MRCHAAGHHQQQQQQQEPPEHPQMRPESQMPQQPCQPQLNDYQLRDTFPYPPMACLAGLGAAETAYLTASKLMSAQVACPTSGCDTVLSSAYASLFGLPLPLFGAAAYCAVAAAATAAASCVRTGRPPPRWARAGLSAGVGTLAGASGYLMYVLHAHLGGAPCMWCYASAGLSGALLACLVAGLDRRALAGAAGPGLGAAAAAALLLVIGSGAGPAQAGGAADLELPYTQPVVSTTSSDSARSLARRLRDAGAVMYGAFWCSHCFDQKQAFGAEAMADFPYVECFPDGWHKVRVVPACGALALPPQLCMLLNLHGVRLPHGPPSSTSPPQTLVQGVKLAPACEAASVKAFPTWVINGATTEGELELQQLEALLDDTDLGSKNAPEALLPGKLP